MSVSAQSSEVLLHWARWGRKLPRADDSSGSQNLPDNNAVRRMIDAYALVGVKKHVALPGWHPATSLIGHFRAMSRAEGARLGELYSNSKRRLFPLSDPLDVQFPLHRQLYASREEVYSDWLAWVLEQVADVRLVARILGLENKEGFSNSLGPVSVDREIPVARGHIHQTGRLDLVVNQGSQTLAVIEVKTQPFTDRDLEKHRGYCESIGSPGVEMIFLWTTEPDSDMLGFRFLSWADVCIRLRRIAPRLLGSEQVVGTALILAFVGAVEQNLLGFVGLAERTVPVTKIPRMVDHFTKAVQEDLLGQS